MDNTEEDCLLYHLLQYGKEAPASRELFETYFTTIRYRRKKAIPEKENLSFSKIK